MPGALGQSGTQMPRSPGSPGSSTLQKSGQATFRRAKSTGALAKSAQVMKRRTQQVPDEEEEPPAYLAVHASTKPHRRLAASTGNLHGFMAEDYRKINWPLPEMFGEEKYAHSLVNIKDPTFLGEKTDHKKFAPGQTIHPAQWKRGQAKDNLHNRKECADMSKQLIRLHYDQQIIDLEWRKAYKVLLDAEHKKMTLRPREGLPAKFMTSTTNLLQKDVDNAMKSVLELQEQKDIFESEIKTVYDRCATIKAQLDQEHFLEDMRRHQVDKTREQKTDDDPFWGNKFNINRDKKNFVTATGNSYKTIRDP